MAEWHWAFVVALGALLVSIPVADAGPVPIAWPSDLDAGALERAGSISGSLGIDFDYVLSRGQLPPGSVGTWDAKRGVLPVALPQMNGTFRSLELRPDRFEERRTDCLHPREMVERNDGTMRLIPCEEEEVRVEVRYVLPAEQLPVGIRVSSGYIRIEGPPAAFAAFGTGVDAVRSVADRLGIPVEEVPWENAMAVDRSFGAQVPGIDQVGCVCSLHVLADEVKGANRLFWALDETGHLVSFESGVWLAESTPIVTADDVQRILHERLSGLGFPDPEAEIILMWNGSAGLHWKVWVDDHRPVGGRALAAYAFDAHDGSLLYEIWFSLLEPEPMVYAPTLWQIGLVGVLAWMTTWRYRNDPVAKRSDDPPVKPG